MKIGVFHIFISVVLVVLSVATSCTDQRLQQVPHKGNAVYYWRTTWQLSDKEREFISQNDIQRVYLRLFDVVGQYEEDGQQKGVLVPMPRATLHLNEPYDLSCEVIPVVFVTDECMLVDTMLAEKIVTRVAQFCETNDLVWSELQLDCDWRPSTREAYFNFLNKVRNSLQQRGDYRLSATIRLHQFSQPAPPVDYGVLMCYNTGNLSDNKTVNAILEKKEVEKYTGKLANYTLPLTAAYPVYTWKRLFRNGRFQSLLNSVDLSDSTSFQNCGNGIFKVKGSVTVATPDPSIFGFRLVPGDTIKYDFVPADTICAVKQLLEVGKSDIHQQVIVYSLNENDFSKYTPYEITTLYTSSK